MIENINSNIVLESIGEGVIITNEDGKIIFINRCACDILSIDCKSANNKIIDEVFIVKDISSKSSLLIDKVFLRENKFSTGLVRGSAVKDQSGNMKFLSAVISPIYVEGVYRGSSIVFRDITKIKNSEQLLEVEKENFAKIFENAPLGMFVVDKEFKIKKINSAACNIFFVNDNEFENVRICQVLKCKNFYIYKGRSKNCEKCMFRKVISKALFEEIESSDVEFLFQYMDENNETYMSWLKISTTRINFQGMPHVLVSVEDITSNKEMAKMIIKNEKKLRLITDNMIDNITQINSEGIIEFTTPASWDLVGISPEDLVGKSFADLIYGEDMDLVHSFFKKRIKTKDNFKSQFRLRRSDGKIIWAEAKGSVIDDDDRERKVIYVIRDITEELEHKMELEKTKEEAVAANEAKSQFLANMSHEIRTPINGIIGMTNITLMGKLGSEERENLELVKDSANSLLNIINAILDFSKIESGKMEIDLVEFNLRESIEKIVKTFNFMIKDKKVQFIYKINDDVPNILIGDYVKINQVIKNLVSNAIKFTDEGTVSLNIDSIKINPNLINFLVSVDDTGIGIKDEDKVKLFNSFSQVDGSITRKYGGTGLGLSISKKIVESLNGKISLISEFGRGSTFKFEIPMKFIDNDAEIEINQKKESGEMINGLKVLLVEDNKVGREIARKILEKKGSYVVVAKNGIEAVEKFESGSFDVILMDIQMPEMDGITATKIIKNKCKEKGIFIPIIAITAYAIEGDEKRFIYEGMDDYISKPIDFSNLFRIIMRNIDRNFKNNGNSELQKIISDISKGKAKKLDKVANKNEVSTMLSTLNKFFLKKEYMDFEMEAHKLKKYFSEIGDDKGRKFAFKLELASRKNNDEDIVSSFNELVKYLEKDEGWNYENINS